jgi:hypothetical protein
VLQAVVFRIRTSSLPVGMNEPGIDNKQFALNIVHWLSGLLEPRQTEPRR